MKIIILISLLVLNIKFTIAQQFEFPLNVSDGITSRILTIGINPQGTDSFDIGLDVLAPPLPPSGIFDARLKFMNEDYYKDIRNNSILQKNFNVYYSPSTGRNIILSWDSSIVNTFGDFKIVDNITGNLFTLDMSLKGSISISSNPVLQNSLRILSTPATPTNIKEQTRRDYNKPDNFILYQNYPNPFNSSTQIKFHIAENNSVKIKIFDLSGSLVYTLCDTYLQKGEYSMTWDGSNNPGLNLSGGMYLCQIRVGNKIDTKKLIYLK